MKSAFVYKLFLLLTGVSLFLTVGGFFLKQHRAAQDRARRDDQHLLKIYRHSPVAAAIDAILDEQMREKPGQEDMVLSVGLHNPPLRKAHKKVNEATHDRMRALLYKIKKDAVSSLNAPMIAYQHFSDDSENRSLCSLMKGTSIPLVLMMDVFSQPVGLVRAQVMADVYDSVSLDHVLIPSGSRFIGHIDQNQSAAAERLFVVFDALIFPGGRTMTASDFYSSDKSGAAGNTATVDHHYFRNLAPRFVLSVLSSIPSLLFNHDHESDSVGSIHIHVNGRDPESELVQKLGENLMDPARRWAAIAPTLQLKKGDTILIINKKTINFVCSPAD